MKPGRIVLGLAVLATMAFAVAPATAGAGTAKYGAVRSPGGHAVRAPAAASDQGAGAQANWVPAGTMDTAVGEIGGGAFSGGQLFVPGGYTATSLHDKMQVYTASSNTWSTDPQVMPAPASLGAPGWADSAVCADTSGAIYVVNGVDGAFLYSALQIYDTTQPIGSRWFFGPNPNVSAFGNFYSQDSGCAVLGGTLYLFAGYGGDDLACCTPQTRTLALNLSTGVWSDTGQNMNTARFWHGYGNISQAAVAAGGTNDLVGFTPLASAERYQPSTGWVSVGNLPQARLAPGLGIVNIGGNFRAAVFGGQNSAGTNLASTVACLLPACGAWNDINRNLNTARSFHAWGSATSNLYAAGGFSATSVLSSAEKIV